VSNIIEQFSIVLVRTSAPMIFAAIGELITERAGILNLGCDGIILASAAIASLIVIATGNYALAFVGAIITGVILGALLAYFAIDKKANQTITGLIMNFLTYGLAIILYRLMAELSGTFIYFKVLGSVSIPILSDIPYIGKVFFNQPFTVYMALLIIPLMYFLINYTRVGLYLRAVGHSARVSDYLGINVRKIRYLATLVGTSLLGISGAHLALVEFGSFNEQMTGGIGWLGILSVILGGWKPIGVTLATLFFNGVRNLAIYLTIIIKLPSQVILMLPFIVTLIVMGFASKRFAEAPADLAVPYIKREKL